MKETHFLISHAKGARRMERRRSRGTEKTSTPSEWTIAALFGSISPKMTISTVMTGTTQTSAPSPKT